jgi:hypothetical protein
MWFLSLHPPQFTAKSLNRQAKKAQKDENAEKSRLKKVRVIPFNPSPPSLPLREEALALLGGGVLIAI